MFERVIVEFDISRKLMLINANRRNLYSIKFILIDWEIFFYYIYVLDFIGVLKSNKRCILLEKVL